MLIRTGVFFTGDRAHRWVRETVRNWRIWMVLLEAETLAFVSLQACQVEKVLMVLGEVPARRRIDVCLGSWCY